MLHKLSRADLGENEFADSIFGNPRIEGETRQSRKCQDRREEVPPETHELLTQD